jgi:hypothetical protein
METPSPWPKLRDEDKWLTDVFEDLLAADDAEPDKLRARAQQLRDEVADNPPDGDREAALALAERYEQAAAARSTAR